MPDWFYRTVARPLLFRLPDRTGRAVALGVIGHLGRSSAGRAVIELLGHMQPDSRLEVLVGDTQFPSPIGLGWRVDPERRATEGLLCFGVGCIEENTTSQRRVARGGGETLVDGDECGPGTRSKRVERCLRREIDGEGNEYVVFPSGQKYPIVSAEEFARAPLGGVMIQIGEKLAPDRWTAGSRLPRGLLSQIAARKSEMGSAPLIVSGGISEPHEALDLLNAGVDLILIEAGLVFRGPGLVKRCNEAILSRLAPPVVTPETNLFRQSWLWATGLGAGLLIGGIAALVLAGTRVLLPYDEHYIGFTGLQLRHSLPRLFAFMAHDRGTLAGTMVGLGGYYIVLAVEGIRHAVHGAKTALVVSAFAGFMSFFSFFGFGYFDALHAFVAAILFQLTLQIMVGSSGPLQPSLIVIDSEDRVWRRSQWAQLLWIIHAAGLLIAGATILYVGMTDVMVSTDLNFLCITRAEIPGFGEKLMSVVAHDRATLGGMLLASGTATLLANLWCFRRGARWLWLATLVMGIPAYTSALGVHFWVGYTDWHHLVPAAIGLALWLGGLVLSRAYLWCAQGNDAKSI